MFISTIIPTIGRASVDQAVKSVLGQAFPDDEFEIIVVNDSGKELPPFEWLADRRIRVVATNRRRLTIARNTGAALARGDYLHFLDDDDWMIDGAFNLMRQLAESYPQAVALYGSALFIDGNGKILGEMNLRRDGNCLAQFMGGAELLCQTSFIKSEAFFATGGFNPRIKPGEEFELWRKITRAGSFAHTEEPVAYILRGAGWTSTCPREVSHQAYSTIRDSAIKEKGSLIAFRSSADTDYWKGRVLRIAAITAVWNLQQRRLFEFISRVLWGGAWFVLSGISLLSKDYWLGFTERVTPFAPERIIPADLS